MSVLRRVRSRIAGLLPYRVRRGLRALVEAPIADPKDVATVAQITSTHWTHPSACYVASYWDGVDEHGAESIGKRRSEWLAALPPFGKAQSILELGCGPGRNLWLLQQRYPDAALYGIDINVDGIAHARAHVRGESLVGDLYKLDELLRGRRVDVIFTMGVLIHLHPDTLPGLIRTMRDVAARALVFVEEVSETDEVVKGPARWRPRCRITGDYIQWSPNLPATPSDLGLPFTRQPVPAALQSNGARDLLVVSL